MQNREFRPRPRLHAFAAMIFGGLAIVALVLGLSGCRVLGYPVPAGAAISTSTPTSLLVAEGATSTSAASTHTPIPTTTWTPTTTPSSTAVPPTDTPVPPTVTEEIPTDTPVPPTDTPTPTNTLQVATATPLCAETPQWGLGDVWQNPEVKERLGCPVGLQSGVQGEEIYFQRGHMLWRPDNGLIYILCALYAGRLGGLSDKSQNTPMPDTDLIPPTPRVGRPPSTPRAALAISGC